MLPCVFVVQTDRGGITVACIGKRCCDHLKPLRYGNIQFVLQYNLANTIWYCFVSCNAAALAFVLKPISAQEPDEISFNCEQDHLLNYSHSPILPPIGIDKLFHRVPLQTRLSTSATAVAAAAAARIKPYSGDGASRTDGRQQLEK